jgi:putative ABC transport system permease protein
MLIQRSLRYYWRSNVAVIAGVAIAVAVLSGALVVGDSVRASLRDLVLERLGRTDVVVASTGFFREQLADRITQQQSFGTEFDGACPLIAMEGFVRDQATGRRAAGVQIYGIDERFWRFHHRQTTGFAVETDALVSEALASELGTLSGGAILARVETRAAIPAESLHGRKEDIGRTLRLTVREVLNPNALGEFSLRPQQGSVRAVFVPLRRLQTALGRRGAVNAILISSRDDSKDKRGAAAAQLVESMVRDSVNLEDLGLAVRQVSGNGLVIESSSSVISDRVAAAARETAARAGLTVAPVLSYLANAIRADGREIPYSVVAALDLHDIASTESADEKGQSSPPIVLNQWAAHDLGARAGSTVSLEYYVWEEPGRLDARSASFHVTGIVPIAGLAADRDLTPNYPGITDSDRLSDWDPPFPIDLKKVRPVDEDYWHQYRTTPKAFVPLEVGQALWKSPYGSLTSLRIRAADGTTTSPPREAFATAFRRALDPFANGLSVVAVRATDLTASRGATDFGEYFTYFSTFLVCSALLLAALFFKLGIEQRVREIGVLQALGFDEGRIRRLFLSEAVLLIAIGALIGMAGAVAYGALMMKGLRTWWLDAVNTTALTLHVSPASLMLGAGGCFVAALLCLWWTLRSLRAMSPRALLAGAASVLSPPGANGRSGASLVRVSTSAICIAAAFGLSAASSRGLIDPTGGFFGAGVFLLVGLLTWASWRLRTVRRTVITGHGWLPVFGLGLRNATGRPGRSLLCIALIASATFIIVSLEAFRRDDTRTARDRRSGTGGYALVAESLLPIVHDLDSRQGRESLGLPAETTGLLGGVRFSRFRLRPGDDASCLNLYRPANPRILGATPSFVREGRFSFQSSTAASAPERANPWLLLERPLSDGAIPVIADANSIAYVLHVPLGDDLVLPGLSDSPIRLRLVGALADSVFQSELLMSEANFRRLFPQQEGYRVFLIDTPESSEMSGTAPVSQTAGVSGVSRTLDSQVSDLLESRLAEFGLDVNTTTDRLAAFHRVEYTYLSTFQMLGGLGVLVGTFGLAAVLLRNVLERRRELAVLRVAGYQSSHFSLMVVAENVLILVSGLVIGTVSALLAISPVFVERGDRLPIASLGLLLAGILASGLLASLVATAAVLRSPVIPALRAE